MGLAPLGGSCERGIFSTYWEIPLQAGTEGSVRSSEVSPAIGAEFNTRSV